MHSVNMNYLSGLEQNNADYSGEVVCSAVEMGVDQENAKLEGIVLVERDQNSSAGCVQEDMQQLQSWFCDTN